MELKKLKQATEVYEKIKSLSKDLDGLCKLIENTDSRVYTTQNKIAYLNAELKNL